MGTVRANQSQRDQVIANRLSEQYQCTANDLAQLTSWGATAEQHDVESVAISETDELALKASRLRKLIEAKQERERNNKRREEERKAEEKRLADQAMVVRPGEGIINWKQIVEAKR